MVRFRLLFLLDLEEEHSTNVKAHFRPNMSNSIRSTCVSPQLEANTRIPVRRNAVMVGVEPPPYVDIAGQLNS